MNKKLTLLDLQNSLLMQGVIESNNLFGFNNFANNVLYNLITEDSKPSLNNIVRLGDLAFLKDMMQDYELSPIDITKAYRLAMELGKVDMVEYFVMENKQNLNLVFKNELAHPNVKKWAINFQALKELNKDLNDNLTKKEIKTIKNKL